MLSSPPPVPSARSAAQPLRQLRLDETEIGPGDTIVRPTPPGLLGMAVLSLGFAAFVGRDAARGGLGWAWAGPLIFALCWMAWMGYRGWRRYKRAGVWLMAVGAERVLIRFRSVVSEHLPSDLPQVIELPLARIASVRVTHRKTEEKSGDSTRRTSYDYLDFRLRDTDLQPLRDVLVQDQWTRSRRWFAQRDPSVAVTAGGLLRVEMGYDGAATQPDVGAVVKLLAPRVAVEPEAWEHFKLSGADNLSAAEQDATLRAVGETSASRAHALAAKYFPDAPREDVAAYVEHLLAPEAQPGAPSPAPGPPAGDPARSAPRLLSRAEARPDPGDALVRPRHRGYLVSAVVFAALTGWLGWLGYEGRMRWWLALLLGLVTALISRGALLTWIQTRRHDNWLMAIGGSRVMIRFRSFLHDHFPAEDPQVVELPLAHVVSVRQTRQKVTRPATKQLGAQHRHVTYLDIRTRGLNLAPLWDALVRERSVRHLGVRRDHDPVQLVGDGVVRVEMIGRATTRPRIDEVLRLLGRQAVVEEGASEEVFEGTELPAASLEEHEAAVQALARAGQTLAAIQLARTLFGDGLVKAKARVQRLADEGGGGQDASS